MWYILRELPALFRTSYPSVAWQAGHVPAQRPARGRHCQQLRWQVLMLHRDVSMYINDLEATSLGQDASHADFSAFQAPLESRTLEKDDRYEADCEEKRYDAKYPGQGPWTFHEWKDFYGDKAEAKWARGMKEPALGAEVEPVEWDSWSESRWEEFMKEIWQQKPLLVRNAFPSLRDKPLLPPEELMRLATDKEATSRMIFDLATAKKGPFSEEFLMKQRKNASGRWALLVNDCERWVPELKDFLDNFKCIPTWRFGDVMVSLAPAGAGIGGHVDSYDVFLLQGSGVREWSISSRFLSSPEEVRELALDTEIRVFRNFSATHKWVLDPGDMLYLPPRIPHYGVSKSEDCTTISIGFTMPYLSDVVRHFAHWATQDMQAANPPDEWTPYGGVYDPQCSRLSTKTEDVMAGSPSDADGGSQLSSDVIASAKEFVRSSLLEALDDDRDFSKWFGTFVTRPQRKPGFGPSFYQESNESREHFDWTIDLIKKCEGLKLVHPGGVKCAYIMFNGTQDRECDRGGLLFFDGESFGFPWELRDTVPKLTARGAELSSEFITNAPPALMDLLRKLVRFGMFELGA